VSVSGGVNTGKHPEIASQISGWGTVHILPKNLHQTSTGETIERITFA